MFSLFLPNNTMNITHSLRPTLSSDLTRLIGLATQLEHPVHGMYNYSGQINGPGFFPAAWGGTDPLRPLQGRSVMIVGQDQDSIAGYRRSKGKESEEHTSTWRNLMTLLADAGIPEEACFFTNYIMGIRRSGPATGPSPALACEEFMRHCTALFLEQLRIQQPRIIVPLGMIPFQLLALASEDLRFRAIGTTNFKDIDRRGLASSIVNFELPEPFTAQVVPVCHPSYPQNGRARDLLDRRREADVLVQAFTGTTSAPIAQACPSE